MSTSLIKANAPGPGDGTDATLSVPLMRWGWILLSIAAVPVLAHAFIPTMEFIHRGDDAFYYFKTAVLYPRLGFWSFDGVHPTNGVQPLWALLLTAAAYPLHWLGASDSIAARAFVALTAAFHFASGMLLYRLLARTVSVGTALASAGGWLLPLAIVWSHVWGMENSLYATLLVWSVSYFHLTFLPRPDRRGAVALGLLLGLTCLSRLNSGLLVPWILAAYLVASHRIGIRQRLRLAGIVCLGVAVLVVPYVAWNVATTGHLLPISGEVKEVQAARWLAERGLETRFSRDFASAVFWQWRFPTLWFLTSRALDGLWVLGARIPFVDSSTSVTSLVTTSRGLLAVMVALVAVPFFVGSARTWRRVLGDRARRLSRFWYVAGFAFVNAALSVTLYPTEIYSITRWWLAESELAIVVTTATLVAATVAYLGRRLPTRIRLGGAVTATALLVLYHGAETIQFYWDGEKQTYDWNQSWNDQPYRAALWMNANLPPDAVVGAWNAGVLGYYSTRTVVNLDGLINNFDLLPFIESGTTAEYVRREGISYLSDLQPAFDARGILDELPVSPIYTSWTPWGAPYRVYGIHE